jgi:hypothetical protein
VSLGSWQLESLVENSIAVNPDLKAVFAGIVGAGCARCTLVLVNYRNIMARLQADSFQLAYIPPLSAFFPLK